MSTDKAASEDQQDKEPETTNEAEAAELNEAPAVEPEGAEAEALNAEEPEAETPQELSIENINALTNQYAHDQNLMQSIHDQVKSHYESANDGASPTEEKLAELCGAALQAKVIEDLQSGVEPEEIFKDPTLDPDASMQAEPQQFVRPYRNTASKRNFKALKAMQKAKAQQQPGSPTADFIDLNQENMGQWQAMERSLFHTDLVNQDNQFLDQGRSSSIFDYDATDVERLEQKKKRDQELLEAKEKMSDQEAAQYVPFSQKLGIHGFNVRGSNTLGISFRDGNSTQQVFDDGKNVRVRTNGTFNAKSAMAMAVVYQKHRRTDENGMPRTTMPLSINIRPGPQASAKRNLMLIANLHTANRDKMGLDVQFKTGIGFAQKVEKPDLQEFYDNNKEGLEQALLEYNKELHNMGEPQIGSVQELLDQQNDIKNGFDNDIDLSDDVDPNAPAAQPETDPDGPENDGGDSPENDADDAAVLDALNGTDEEPGTDVATLEPSDLDDGVDSAPLPPILEIEEPKALEAPEAPEGGDPLAIEHHTGNPKEITLGPDEYHEVEPEQGVGDVNKGEAGKDVPEADREVVQIGVEKRLALPAPENAENALSGGEAKPSNAPGAKLTDKPGPAPEAPNKPAVKPMTPGKGRSL